MDPPELMDWATTSSYLRPVDSLERVDPTKQPPQVSKLRGPGTFLQAVTSLTCAAKRHIVSVPQRGKSHHDGHFLMLPDHHHQQFLNLPSVQGGSSRPDVVSIINTSRPSKGSGSFKEITQFQVHGHCHRIHPSRPIHHSHQSHQYRRLPRRILLAEHTNLITTSLRPALRALPRL